MNRKRTAIVISAAALAGFLAAALAIPTFAQFDGPPPGGGFHGGPRGGGGPMGRSMTAGDIPVHVLAVELDLTSDQKSKIQSIQDNAREQRRALFTPGEPPDQSTFDKMRDLDKSTSAQVDAVLTDDQRADLKPLLKSIGNAREAGIPVEIYADLKLTDNQKAAIADLAASNRKAMQAAFENGPSGGGFESMRSMRAKTQSKLKALLTDKQYALIEQYQKKHPRRGFGGPGGGPGMRPHDDGGFGGPQGGGGGFNGPPQGDGPSADNAGPAPGDDQGPPPDDGNGPPPPGDEGGNMPPPPGDDGGN